jgi:hypothetical protein
MFPGETKVGCENCQFSKVIHPVVGYRGEFLDNTQIVEEDIDTCYMYTLNYFVLRCYHYCCYLYYNLLVFIKIFFIYNDHQYCHCHFKSQTVLQSL